MFALGMSTMSPPDFHNCGPLWPTAMSDSQAFGFFLPFFPDFVQSGLLKLAGLSQLRQTFIPQDATPFPTSIDDIQ
jgi:hypothetical protein